jgi:hypothetical protein
MKRKNLELYWKAWFERAAKGDPFSFLDYEGEEEAHPSIKSTPSPDHQSEEEEEQEKTHPTTKSPPPPEFAIDDGILLPCECDTPTLCTSCLRQLVPKKGSAGKTFHNLIKLVGALEVSSVNV